MYFYYRKSIFLCYIASYYAFSEYHFIVIIFKLIKHVLYLLGSQFVVECCKYMFELVGIR